MHRPRKPKPEELDWLIKFIFEDRRPPFRVTQELREAIGAELKKCFIAVFDGFRILNDPVNDDYPRPFKAMVIIWPYGEGVCEWFVQYDVLGMVTGIVRGDQVPCLEQVARRISDDLERKQ